MQVLKLDRLRFVTLLALTLIVGSLLYLYLPNLYFAVERRSGVAANAHYWQQNSSSEPSLPMRLGTPLRLDLDRLGIHLPIAHGQYDVATRIWALDDIHAFFMNPGQFPLSASAQPLIYAHEIRGIFLGLNGVSVNEPLVITNTAGQKLYFRYVGDNIIRPSQVDQINKPPAERGLTLLTCTNPYFSQRRLFYFAYVGTDLVQTAAASTQAPS